MGPQELAAALKLAPRSGPARRAAPLVLLVLLVAGEPG